MIVLPSQFAIDYEELMSAARPESGERIVLFMQEHLPVKWRDVYVATAEHQTNLASFRVGNFEYICDLYTQLEVIGEISYDQTVQDRVVAVFGTSAPAGNGRDTNRTRGWVRPQEELFATERDTGHFIARCVGGGVDLNLFSQDRKLNRGSSLQGKTYRQMETYCCEHPGTFCFSRPIYIDGSSVPRWVEFGVLKAHDTLWIEVFDN